MAKVWVPLNIDLRVLSVILGSLESLFRDWEYRNQKTVKYAK